MSEYLSKKYSAYCQQSGADTFCVAQVQHELCLDSYRQAEAVTRNILGRLKSEFDFKTFCLVIISYLEVMEV